MHQLRAGALGRPRGMGWGGRREGGLGWGTRVNPWLIHVNVWQKPLQYCKVISFQIIKINEKKNRKEKIKHLWLFLRALSTLELTCLCTGRFSCLQHFLSLGEVDVSFPTLFRGTFFQEPPWITSAPDWFGYSFCVPLL